MARVVLDTNILISGLLHNGKPRRLLELAIEGRMEIVSSAEMIDELAAVLSREKFGLSKEEQAIMVDFIIRLSRITALRSRFKVVKQDPDDDIVINTALDGNAQYIVSGDKKILGLKQFGNIRMLTASEMIGLIDGK